MPLHIGTTTTPPPDPGTDPTPTPTQPSDPGVLRAVWIAPDGTVVPLTDDNTAHFTLDAVTGWGAAPVRIVTDPHPRGGSRVRHIQPQPRTIDWPIRVRGDTMMEFLAGWRYIVRMFTMTRYRGPGILRIYRPDGTAREIEAYYEGGFDGEPGQGWTWDTAVVSLYCEDPYWRDIEATSDGRDHIAVDVDYFDDPFPAISSGDDIDGATTINNPGEAEAWVTWTVTGPATALIATNNTTGESFELTYTLLDDETITMTTDPVTVRGPAGQVLTSALNWPGAQPWGLQPGDNDVEFVVTGASDGARIRWSYTARYETA